MRRLLAATAAAAAVLMGGPAMAQFDPEIHKLCIEAKDYAGCVKAMTGTSDGPKSPTSVMVIEGERELTGNSCPEDMAYAGAGWCRSVICISRSSGHSSGLGGKRWACPLGMGLAMSWGSSKVKATNDPSCPQNPPDIGWRSSCEQQDYAD